MRCAVVAAFLAPFLTGPLLADVDGVALAARTKQAWEVLDQSLRDGNSEHRQQAVAALATLGQNSTDAARRASEALKDKDFLVRRTAALTLGELNASSAIPDLKNSLADNFPEVAFAAAKALTQLGDSSGREVLIAVLAGERKDTPGVWTNAMRKAKEKLRHPQGLLLLGVEDATGAMFGPAAVAIPAVKDAAELRSKGAPGRAAAAAYIAKYPDEYSIRLLEWALNDDNMFVRLEAARALGQRGDAASIDRLVPVLNDEHNFVRAFAAASIVRICARGGEPGKVTTDPVVIPQTTKRP